jgi:hypothetical protein
LKISRELFSKSFFYYNPSVLQWFWKDDWFGLRPCPHLPLDIYIIAHFWALVNRQVAQSFEEKKTRVCADCIKRAGPVVGGAAKEKRGLAPSQYG